MIRLDIETEYLSIHGTQQEIFDRVVEHLRQQGRRSWDKYCRYRIEDGRRCAIGIFIPDDRYDPAVEGAALETMYDDVFLQRLQDMHDAAHDADTINAYIDEFVRVYGFVRPEPITAWVAE